MAKKDGKIEELTEQAQIIVTKEDDVKVKSPPISYRTRSGRSKIPRKRLNVTDDLATANDENLDVRNNEKEYSSDSESSLEEELEQEAIVDPSKAEKNADEVYAMSSDQLKERLTTLGIVIGPIVPSTRKIYEKKLINLMNKADLQYSTDEDESVGAIAEEVKEEVPVFQKAKKTRGKKREEGTVQDKFSDDEDDIPVVKNSSSRRRSTRISKVKVTEQVTVEEPISEETEEPVENGSTLLVVENGTGDATAEPVKEQVIIEEDPVVEDDPAAPVTEQTEEFVPQDDCEDVTQTARPIPYHTIAVVLIVAILIAFIWRQRDQHIVIVESAFNWMVHQYTKLYDSLMPDVEQLPPVEPPPVSAT